MNRSKFLFGLLSLLALEHISAAPTPSAKTSPRADIVFRHGAVYTEDSARSWAEGVAVSNGRIVGVGGDREMADWIGPQTLVVDLAGRMLLPGFHDSHVHPILGGIGLNQCDLHDITNRERVLQTIEVYAREHSTLEWIRGAGWELPVFPDANPSKALLDSIVPDRPAYFDAADAHSAWVNSRALERAGITKDTPDPPNGHIERDSKTGEPTGTLREAAMELVRKELPKRTVAQCIEGLRRALQLANRFGITSLQDAWADEDLLTAYRELDRRGELTARVLAAPAVDPAKGTNDVERLVRLRNAYRSPRLRATAAKIFADGVIESHTAALLEPYSGSAGDRGKLNFEPEAFKKVARALDREGFQIHVHAIGDRAIRNALDALEFARAQNGHRDSRHQIAHLELIDPSDIPRFRRLDVIANFQPLWAFEDSYIKTLTQPVLGPKRSRWLYPIRSVADTAAIIVCGSDWDVSSMNPLDGIQVAVTRRGPEAGAGPAWIPEERMDLAAMLAAYTINGAYVSFQEKETGSIEPGKAADLIVLDKNLFEIPPEEIHKTKVLLTLLEGRTVYRNPTFAPQLR